MGKQAILHILTRFLEFCSPIKSNLTVDHQSKIESEANDEKITYQASKQEIIADSARIMKFFKACAKESLDLCLDAVVLQALKVAA